MASAAAVAAWRTRATRGASAGVCSRLFGTNRVPPSGPPIWKHPGKKGTRSRRAKKAADEKEWKHSAERAAHIRTAERRAVGFFVVTTSIVGIGALFLTDEGQAYMSRVRGGKPPAPLGDDSSGEQLLGWDEKGSLDGAVVRDVDPEARR